MKTLKLSTYFLLILSITSCGEAERIADEILEEIDTDDKAYISMINGLNQPISFHIKNEIYSRSVYNSDFFFSEVSPNEVGSTKQYQWVDGYEETEIAIKNANTKEARHSIEFNMKDDKSYWLVAWKKGGEDRVSAFEKEHIVSANKFNVRIFSEGAHTITINNGSIGSTNSGKISARYSFDNCDELTIGNVLIDLCSIGSIGQVYLIVIDAQGSYLVAQE